jgi:hypothetical protein
MTFLFVGSIFEINGNGRVKTEAFGTLNLYANEYTTGPSYSVVIPGFDMFPQSQN